MECNSKFNEKCMPVLHCISSFEGTYRKLQDTDTSSFVSCCFTSAFTSADIIFYNFLELQSTKCDKNCLSIFPNVLVRHHCQILLLPRNHQKTKKNDWFAHILLKLEAKFWWQSRKTNNFKPTILQFQFLKWYIRYMSLIVKFIVALEELKTVFSLLWNLRDKPCLVFNMFLWNSS